MAYKHSIACRLMGAGPGTMLAHLGAAARDARMQKGRHQGHIAAEIGVDQGTIRRFEQGKHWPRDPEAMIAAYARDLELDPRDLWDEAMRRWRAE